MYGFFTLLLIIDSECFKSNVLIRIICNIIVSKFKGTMTSVPDSSFPFERSGFVIWRNSKYNITCPDFLPFSSNISTDKSNSTSNLSNIFFIDNNDDPINVSERTVFLSNTFITIFSNFIKSSCTLNFISKYSNKTTAPESSFTSVLKLSVPKSSVTYGSFLPIISTFFKSIHFIRFICKIPLLKDDFVGMATPLVF